MTIGRTILDRGTMKREDYLKHNLTKIPVCSFSVIRESPSGIDPLRREALLFPAWFPPKRRGRTIMAGLGFDKTPFHDGLKGFSRRMC